MDFEGLIPPSNRGRRFSHVAIITNGLVINSNKTCIWQVLIIRPLITVFSLISIPLTEYALGLGLPVRLYLMISNLPTMKFMLFSLAHLQMTGRSSLKESLFSVQLNGVFIIASWTKDVALKCLVSALIFPVIIKNNRGPETEPWVLHFKQLIH